MESEIQLPVRLVNPAYMLGAGPSSSWVQNSLWICQALGRRGRAQWQRKCIGADDASERSALGVWYDSRPSASPLCVSSAAYREIIVNPFLLDQAGTEKVAKASF